MHSFEKVFVDKESLKDPVTEQIVEVAGEVSVEEVTDKEEVRDYVLKGFSDPVGAGKRVLYLTQNRGDKIKKCPGTTNKICCGYYVVNLYTNCPIDCSYCILQKYLNNPFITVYTNIEDYLLAIGSFLKQHYYRTFRVGTGELADSLALDCLTSYSTMLIDFFRNHENATLELKTKSNCIQNVLKTLASPNTVISWSLNPQRLVESDELYAASLDERLDAAKECSQKGYKVGFHFDPVIIYEGWEKDYGDVVDKIFEKVKPQDIAWISLGALRFEKSLRPIISERFEKSIITAQEFIAGSDNKFRYLRESRIKMFRFLSQRIRDYCDSVYIYLCMEDEYVWNNLHR